MFGFRFTRLLISTLKAKPLENFSCNYLKNTRKLTLFKQNFRNLSVSSTLVQMLKQGVVPDVIDTEPANVVEIQYGEKVVSMGNQLTPSEVRAIPTVIQWPVEEGAFYTLCMTDPDAPCRENPKYREWHHWLVINIQGSDVSSGTTMSEYVGAGPPKGTGLHRYVYVIYKQPGQIKCDEKHLTNTSGDHRGKFKIRNFAKKYKLGEPIAANFFLASWDDYVPLLYEQLAGET